MLRKGRESSGPGDATVTENGAPKGHVRVLSFADPHGVPTHAGSSTVGVTSSRYRINGHRAQGH